jgi:hypothetical protein
VLGKGRRMDGLILVRRNGTGEAAMVRSADRADKWRMDGMSKDR